ncbi:MAG TPA: TrbG/VirB9 family P-type conjugative transfer protein, partial [Thermoanaerobaculia bacterium]|nr:TrbG/VirB9 family P-type conjugative transfer protein [Thermoanaerobaculia bacterium]
TGVRVEEGAGVGAGAARPAGARGLASRNGVTEETGPAAAVAARPATAAAGTESREPAGAGGQVAGSGEAGRGPAAGDGREGGSGEGESGKKIGAPGQAEARPAAGAPTPGLTEPTAAGGAAPPAEADDSEAPTRTSPAGGQTAEGERSAALVHPFGHGRPVLRCAPLRACTIELEPGEAVLSTASGDSERWVVQVASSGPGGRTALVVVKPTACDLSTNLMVATDRRLYEVALDSPPCQGADAGQGSYNPRLPYTGVLRFSYPDEMLRRFRRAEEAARQRSLEEAAATVPLAPAARLANLNFNYTWQRDRKFPWTPAQVFDDGEHTYIVLPPAARTEEAPALFAVEPGGKTALINYRLERQTFIADRVLGRAVLVAGAGRRGGGQRLEIVNHGRRGN